MRMSPPPHQQVFAAFALYAFGLGSFYPRLPAIKEALGVGEAALGLALIGISVGTFAALTFANPVLVRFGHRRTLMTSVPLMALFFAIATFATGPLALFLLLIPAGLAIGAIEILINLEADRVEARMDRRIMNRSHAFWSIGFGLAGIFGAAMAYLGVSPQMHLAVVVVLVCAGLVIWLSDFQPAPPRPSESTDHGPRMALPTRPIMVLVAISLSAMLLEGASIDWSAIYMSSVFDAPAFMGGLAVATGAFAQASVRYVADGFVDRYSPRLVARVSLGATAAGVIVVVTAPSSAIALLGFALLGAGTSALFPLTMSAAAQRTDRPSAVNVAALAQFSFVAFLVGPPLLGFVAEHQGLRAAFAVGLPLIVVSLILTGALGGKPQKTA